MASKLLTMGSKYAPGIAITPMHTAHMNIVQDAKIYVAVLGLVVCVSKAIYAPPTPTIIANNIKVIDKAFKELFKGFTSHVFDVGFLHLLFQSILSQALNFVNTLRAKVENNK